MTTKLAYVPFGADEETDGYYLGGGGRIKREHEGVTANGNPIGGRWVYRDAAGTFVDIDSYRHDLFERNDICAGA